MVECSLSIIDTAARPGIFDTKNDFSRHCPHDHVMFSSIPVSSSSSVGTRLIVELVFYSVVLVLLSYSTYYVRHTRLPVSSSHYVGTRLIVLLVCYSVVLVLLS